MTSRRSPPSRRGSRRRTARRAARRSGASRAPRRTADPRTRCRGDGPADRRGAGVAGDASRAGGRRVRRRRRRGGAPPATSSRSWPSPPRACGRTRACGAETHDLAAYDDFAKPEEAAAKKAEAAAATENATARRERRRSPGEDPPVRPLLRRNRNRNRNRTSRQIRRRSSSRTPRTDEHERTTRSASPRPRVLPGEAERETRPLLDAAFARFPEVDFCVARVPADAEEVPFTTHEMVRGTPCSGMRAFAEHVLYARHREADAPGFRQAGAPGTRRALAALLAGTAGADAEAARVFEAAEGGGLSAFVATCDGQIVARTCSWTSPWMCAFCARASAWTRRRTSRRTAPSRGSPRTSSTPCSRTAPARRVRVRGAAPGGEAARCTRTPSRRNLTATASRGGLPTSSGARVLPRRARCGWSRR